MLTPINITVKVLKCSINKNANGIHGDYVVDTDNLEEIFVHWGLS
jgi:hypothetical protein